MLELWQRNAAALAGSAFSLQTTSSRAGLGRSSTSEEASALQALMKVLAAEAPGTSFSQAGKDALDSRRQDGHSKVKPTSFHIAKLIVSS